jgi:hypothetical protein
MENWSNGMVENETPAYWGYPALHYSNIAITLHG